MTSDEDLRNELSAKDREIAALLDEVIGGVPQELVEKVDDLEQCVLSMEDQNAKLYRQLNKVTAERDQLRNATHVASYERGIAEGRKQSEHNLGQLLDAVEAYDTANRESDPVVWKRLGQLVALAANIREERS